MFLNSRFDGSGENYRLQTTRIGRPHVEIARPQPNWTQQGAKPLTNRGISTYFQSGRLMAFCENYCRAKHLRRLENFFPWTAERIISAQWVDKFVGLIDQIPLILLVIEF